MSKHSDPEVEDRLLELALEECGSSIPHSSAEAEAVADRQPSEEYKAGGDAAAGGRTTGEPTADRPRSAPFPAELRTPAPLRPRLLVAALLLFGLAVWWGVAQLSTPAADNPSESRDPKAATQDPTGEAPKPLRVGKDQNGKLDLSALPANTPALELPLELSLDPGPQDAAFLRGLRRFTGLRLVKLTHHRSQLSPDQVALSQRVTEAACAELAALRSLEFLHLPPWCALSRQSLQHLAKLPRLHTLWLTSEQVAARDLELLADFLALRQVHVRIRLGDGKHMAALARARQIRSLDFADNLTISDADLLALAPLAGLRRLDLSGCNGLSRLSGRRPAGGRPGPGIRDAGLALLRQLPKLRWLSLRSCQEIQGHGLLHLAECRELRYLDLQGIDALASSFDKLPPSLVELRAGQTRINGPALARLPQLRRLDLHWCTRFGNADLQFLHGRAFEELNLTYCKALDAGCLATLRSFRSLHRLNLFGAKWTDDDALESLASLRGLRFLDLGGLQPYGDRGLRALRKLPRLEELSLQANKQISTAGLRHLLEGGAPLYKLNLYMSPGVDTQALADLLKGREVRKR